MKQIIKHITIIAFLVLGVPAFTNAQSFNTAPGSMDTVLVANTTSGYCNAGTIDTCWRSSVSANAGDRVSVQVWYHNNSGSQVNNVALVLSPQTSPLSSSMSFSGGILVNGGTVASGSARVSFNGGSQTLTFIPGSIRWYPSQSRNGQAVSGESRLFSSNGLPIGDLRAGTQDQGALVADFRVSNNTTISPVTNNCSLSISASPSSITQGDGSTLSWFATNCYNLSISPSVGSVSSSGTAFVRPNGTTTYTITGQGDNGVVSAQTTIFVNNNNWNNNACSVWSFAPERTTINRGESTTLRWNTNNVNYVTISPSVGNSSASSSTLVVPSSTTTYYMTAYCNNGSSTNATTTVQVVNSASSTMQVTTTRATAVRTGSAQLNGIAAPNNNGTTLAWFEYGNTGSLGSRTTTQTVASGNNSYFNDYVTGLAPDTWYFYRAYLQNNSGVVMGDIVRFKTPGGAVDTTYVPPVRTVRPVQIVNNTVVAQSAPSLLELKVNSQYDRMCVNGDMQYTVTYRNVSGINLRDTVLRITHPKELAFVASTQGSYEVVDRTVTVDVGDVSPNEQGIVTLTFRVTNEAVRGALAVTTANVVYTNPNTKAQEDATAYSLINVSDDCPKNLFTGDTSRIAFLPDTLLEWLLLILVILALIILARQLYRKSSQA